MVLGRLPFYGEPEVSPDRSQASSLSAEELVIAYHERTKHHYHRFAAEALAAEGFHHPVMPGAVNQCVACIISMRGYNFRERQAGLFRLLTVW